MPFLERGPVQVQLSHLLHEAAGGHGRVVFLGGEAGIGKTTLTNRFAALVRGRARTMSGACDPLATPRPLGPLLDMQAQLSRRCADLLTHQTDRDALFRGFLADLSAPGQPALVILEDVHWADDATLDLLRFLGRRLEGVPALVLATYRDDEVGDRHPLRVVLGDMATVPTVSRISLEPLSLAAVRTLAAGTGLDAASLHHQTGGNPFFVTEVIAAGGGIPATVRDAVLARAARLPGDARRVLDAGAVLGFRFEAWVLEVIAPAPPEAVDALLTGGMLRVEGDRFVFHHELAREAILNALLPHRARALHRAALDALRDLLHDTDPGRLAHHAEGAGDAAAVLYYAPLAGRQARALNSHREAATQFARALRMADDRDAEFRATLLEAIAHEYGLTGRTPEAVEAQSAALALRRQMGDLSGVGDGLRVLSRLYWSVARPDDAEEAARQSIHVLEKLPPGPALNMAYANWASLRMLRGDWAEAIRTGERVIRHAEQASDTRVLVHALNDVGCALYKAGDHSRGREQLLHSLALSLEHDFPEHVARAYSNLGALLALHYQIAEADHYLAQGLLYCSEHEIASYQLSASSWQALAWMLAGRWDEAGGVAEEVRAGAGTATPRIHALTTLALIAMRSGEREPWPLLDEALSLAQRSCETVRIAVVRAARAEAAWLAGDMARVRQEAYADLDLVLQYPSPRFGGELLSWLALAGEHREAVGGDLFRPFQLQIQGRWHEAAAAWRACGCPYEAAQAQAETGDPPALQTALAEFERLGAQPAAHRVRRLLRRHGGVRVPRGPRASTRQNPMGLTARQLQILQLLAEGLQNQEIADRLYLSAKTVDHHVSAVLGKLGVRSRTEAAREAARLGVPKIGNESA